jgi:hypothetical protein
MMLRCPFCLPPDNQTITALFFEQGGIHMQAAVKYHSEIQTVPFGGKMITFESLTPVLSPKERERRKKDIEKRLYDVFSKYAKAQ